MKNKHLLVFVLSCALSGCSCDGDPGGATDGGKEPPPGTKSIEIRPRDATIVIDGVTPGSVTFSVYAMLEAGGQVEVTDDATLTLTDPTLGTLSGGTFTTNLHGGTTTLKAQLGIYSDQVSIVVKVQRVVIIHGSGTPVPQNPGTIFNNGPDDPSRAPDLVYPNDGVLLPANLGQIELHYKEGHNNNELFEITLTSPQVEIAIYTRCDDLEDGCMSLLDGALWATLSDSNRGGDPVTVQMRGTDDNGSGVGTSSSISLSISAFPVFGGLYYWTTSDQAIMRVDFAAGQQTPEQFFPFSGGGCYGCHALSRNGKRMSLSINGQNDGRITLVDVASKTILVDESEDKREQFQSWNPTSDKFAGVYGDSNPVSTDIRIRDGTSGEVVETIPIGTEPDHPDWSPDGERILFTLVTRHQTSQRPGRGGVSYVKKEGVGWGTAIELIPPIDGLNRYYPTYAPDGQFFLYNESTCAGGEIYNGNCDGDADPSAKLWAMAKGGGTAVKLDQANGPGLEDNGETDLSNTYPRWAPFVDPRWADGTGRVMWFTFSSRREYGLRSPHGSNQLLWMAAIDPDKVLAGQDGSLPAFALRFQDLQTSNHIAQWTTTIIPSIPDAGVSGDGGLDPGHDGGSQTCLGIGEPCDPSNDQCCPGTSCVENGPSIYLCKPDF